MVVKQAFATLRCHSIEYSYKTLNPIIFWQRLSKQLQKEKDAKSIDSFIRSPWIQVQPIEGSEERNQAWHHS